MAAALLASPSMWSPPSSPPQFSPEGSPQLPAMSSPFSFSISPPSRQQQQQQPIQSSFTDDDEDEQEMVTTTQGLTPSRSTISSAYPIDSARRPPAQLESLTPLHGNPSYATTETPGWLTDDLEEEWIEQPSPGLRDEDDSLDDDDDNDDDLGEESMEEVTEETDEYDTGSMQVSSYSPPSASSRLPPAAGANTPYHHSQPSASVYDSINKNKPRIPSSLRYALSQSAATATDSSANNSTAELTSSEADDEANDFVDHGASPLPHLQARKGSSPAPSSPSGSPGGGTFVVHSPSSVGGGAPTQLQEAVRALRGPGGGLGATEEEVGQGGVKPEIGRVKRSAGLMGLFEMPETPGDHEVPSLPPSAPPTHSTIIAKVAVLPPTSTFSFIPPSSGPRTSWKSIRHFSPDDVTPRALIGSEENTPVGVGGATEAASDETPTRPVVGRPPPLDTRRGKGFLRSTAAALAAAQVEGGGSTSEVVPEGDLLGLSTSSSVGGEDRSANPNPSPALLPITSPALIPILSPPLSVLSPKPPRSHVPKHFSTTPSQNSSLAPTTTTPNSQLRLFEFKYDTFTRNHLEALVEEIDALSSGSPGDSRGRGASAEPSMQQERGFRVLEIGGKPSPLIGGEGGEGGDEAESDGGGGRATKRVRLSPTPASSKSFASTTPLSARARRFVRERTPDRSFGSGGTGGTPLSSRSSRYSASRHARRDSRDENRPVTSLSSSLVRATPRSMRRSTNQASDADLWAMAGAGVTSPVPEENEERSGDGESFVTSSTAIRSPRRKFGATTAGAGVDGSYNSSPAFARSLEVSVVRGSSEPKAKFIDHPSPEKSPVEKEEEVVVEEVEEEETSTLPPPAPGATTRDRIGEANALLNRIRARTESKRASAPADVVAVEEKAEEVSPKSPSPKKLRQRVKPSDAPTTTKETNEYNRLAATASASLRDALSSSVAASVGGNTPKAKPPALSAGFTFGTGSAVPSSSLAASPTATTSSPQQSQQRRHFARTPAASISIARRVESGVHPSSINGGSHSRMRSVTTIGPDEVGALLASAGVPSRMIFDVQAGRWVKTAKLSSSTAQLGDVSGVKEEDRSASTEEDPFRDFDTTRGSEGLGGLSGLGISTAGTPEVVETPSMDGQNHFLAPPVEERNDEENVEIVSSRMGEEDDSAGWGVVLEEPEGDVSTEEAENAPGEATATMDFREESPFELFQALHQPQQAPAPVIHEPAPAANIQQPRSSSSSSATSTLLPPDIAEPLQISISNDCKSPAQQAASSIPTTPRPALTTQAPRSALKGAPLRTQSAPGLTTPLSAISEPRPPRSVSFSDGKTSGPIDGLRVPLPSLPSAGSKLKFEVAGLSGDHVGPGVSAIGRSYGEPGSLEMEEEEEESVFGSPTAVIRPSSTFARSLDRALLDLQTDGHLTAASAETSIVVGGSSEGAPRFQAKSSRSTKASQSRTFRRTTSLDATFMTDCSFGVAKDRLVQFITDVQPFEPDWEGLKSIDLSKKGAESVMRLKDFLPNLDEVDLSDNELGFLTGIPSTVRTLLLTNNKISSLTSFGHLRNLERLDISNNQIDSVDQFACLLHLRELKADNNRISDLGGLADLDSLIKLSLKGNEIESLDLSVTRWTRLEHLNLSHNRLATLLNVNCLPQLTLLNLDHNCLTELRPLAPTPRLRVLRICSNPITSLNVSFAHRLRTLFVDASRLGVVEGFERLRKLENLSLRDQVGGPLTLSMHDVRDVRRLYLSGNPLPVSFPTEKFFNLTFLELAMCGITHLPADLSELVPNVRVLNLNFNFLEDLTPLIGLTRVQKLSVVGARLSKYKPVARVLGTMSELEEVDLRSNPLTLAFYPPLVLQDGPDLPPHSEYRIVHPSSSPAANALDWITLDNKFRRALPDVFYLKRMSYRALVLTAVPALKALDGLECGKERGKLARKLGKLVVDRDRIAGTEQV